MTRAQKAKENFESGMNCSQAVAAAFSDVLGVDESAAKRLCIGLGGGVGRLREVCGAVSAAAMILGAAYGGDDGTDKAKAYKKVQEFAEKFKEKNGFITCRELRGLEKGRKESFIPDKRTEEYYKIRPCSALVYDAAEIVSQMLECER